jgi:hypothetical protein
MRSEIVPGRRVVGRCRQSVGSSFTFPPAVLDIRLENQDSSAGRQVAAGRQFLRWPFLLWPV